MLDAKTAAAPEPVDDAEDFAPYAPAAAWTRVFLTNEFGLVVLIAIFALAFRLATPGFASPFNLFAMGRAAAVNIVVGQAMMVVIVTGGLDLSIGAVGVSAAMVCGWLIQVVGLPWPLALLGGVAMGAALGLVNGWAVVRTGLHSFIITLASMSIFFGVMIFLTHAESYRGIPPAISTFGSMRLWGFLSPLLIIAILVTIGLAALYRLTALGREMLAAGASPQAAELSGVRVERIVMICHALTGALAAIAALMLVAAQRGGDPFDGGAARAGLAAAGLPRPCARRHAPDRRAGLAARRIPRRAARHDPHERVAPPASRRVLGSGDPRAPPARRRPDGSGAAGFPDQPENGVIGVLSRLGRADWFGPALVTVLAVALFGALRPAFLSPLNIQVLLLAVAINALVAYSQMIIIAIGQINLSVGAIGGLAAISFAGMMEVWGLPAPLAALLALLIGLAAGVINGVFIAATGISAFVITLASLSIVQGDQSRHHARRSRSTTCPRSSRRRAPRHSSARCPG